MAVIFFDMDGTLLDTEKYFRRFWQQAAVDCGYFLTDEQALAMRSLGKPFAGALMEKFLQDPLAYGRIRKRRMELMTEQLKQGIPLKPYAKETLEELHKSGHILAIATATDSSRTEAYLEETGLRPYFHQIICANMVEHGKPAPDIYLYACQVMEVKPEAAYAVEDSPNGVKAAAAAGLQVIMVPDQTQPDEELSGLLWEKIEHLGELIAKLPLDK